MKLLRLLLILLAIFIISQQGIIAKTLYAIKDAQGNMIGVTDMNSLPGDMVEQGCTLEYLSGDKPVEKTNEEIQSTSYNDSGDVSTTKSQEISTDTSPWYKISQWQGKSIKNTETFHIPTSEWRISWKTEPGEYGDMNFQIYVYEPPSELPDVVANVIGRDTDSSIMRGAGDYYLTINSAQQYEVIIDAKY